MTMDIFIDGADELLVQGGLVRVNLVVNSPTERDAEGKHVREVRYRLIMTPLAVTELHRGIEGALRHLADTGIVTRRPAGSEPQPA